MSADNIDMAALRQKVFGAQYTDDPKKMKEALKEVHFALVTAEYHACSSGTRKERAERVFDFLGFDEIAAEGKKDTGEAICEYILYRMQKDKRDRPTQAYYDDVAHKICVDPRVVQRYWSDNQARFVRPFPQDLGPDIPDPQAHLLEQIRLCYKNEGQRLTKKPR